MRLLGAWDCSQPGFLFRYKTPSLYKPPGRISAVGQLWGPKHKQGPWVSPKTRRQIDGQMLHRTRRTHGDNRGGKSTFCYNRLIEPGQIMPQAIFWAAFRESPGWEVNCSWSFCVALCSPKISPDWPSVDKWAVLLLLKGNLIPFKFKSFHGFLRGLSGAHVEINKLTVCPACFHYHFFCQVVDRICIMTQGFFCMWFSKITSTELRHRVENWVRSHGLDWGLREVSLTEREHLC